MEATAQPHENLIADLKLQIRPVLPDDPMAEAGRKILLNEFVKMLEHEAGSRSGEDSENVHDMRVATRRMRSAFRLLEAYYKPKTVHVYDRSLRRLGRALGAVRDLDVLIENILKFRDTLTDGHQAALQAAIDHLKEERKQVRQDLIKTLDKRAYRRFVDDFADFLTRPGAGAKNHAPADDVTPSRVRHILPTLIYSHLGAVRAYDGVVETADDTTLHALRIEFKRLRYAVSMFSEVLGAKAKDFETDLKRIQDCLGEIQDIHTAQFHLNELASELEEAQASTLTDYVEILNERAETLRADFNEVWRQFNRKTVQSKLASAVAVL